MHGSYKRGTRGSEEKLRSAIVMEAEMPTGHCRSSTLAQPQLIMILCQHVRSTAQCDIASHVAHGSFDCRNIGYA